VWQEPDSVRLDIEEVRLAVGAHNDYGRRDPNLQIEDILVLEHGTPQQLKSVRRVPASVLLMIDTGSSEILFKRIELIKEMARLMISNLGPGNEISVLGFNNKVEILHPWTKELSEANASVGSKLFSGRRLRLSEAIMAAVAHLKDRPLENRHVVMITDGVESRADNQARREAIDSLIKSRAAVSVLSFTALGRLTAVHQRRITRRGIVSPQAKYVDLMLPPGRDWDIMRKVKTTPSWVTIYLDKAMRERIKVYEAQSQVSETQLTSLAVETGGRIWIPESEDEMLAAAEEVAHSVNSYYVITFKPTRQLAIASRGEYRRIQVVSRRVGLNLWARKGYEVQSVLRK
jgi:VWFA-related protein